jgi:opacity protein-like surface antigen
MIKIAGVLLISVACTTAAPTVATVGIGARAYGMANAYTAVANDYSALFWNPAGMAFIPIREAHFAADWQQEDALVEFGGKTSDARTRRARISSGGLLRSLPTTRGGYAFALGYSSPYILDDLLCLSGPDVYQGTSPLPGFSGTIENGDTLVRDSTKRVVTGQLNLWNAGMGWQIAPGLAFGFSLGLLTGGENARIEKSTSLTSGTPFADTLFIFESGYLGYDARIGFFYLPTALFSLGCRLELPRYAKLGENDRVFDRIDSSGTDGWSGYGRLNSSWNAAIGAAVHLPWATISVDGTGRAPYRNAPDHTDASWWKGGLRAGCELPLPWISSLLRGGYAFQQLDQAAMRITWDDYGVDPEQTIAVVRNRHLVTAGYSLLLAGSISIEAAYGYQLREFSSTDPEWRSVIEERHAAHRVMASVAIRY